MAKRGRKPGSSKKGTEGAAQAKPAQDAPAIAAQPSAALDVPAAAPRANEAQPTPRRDARARTGRASKSKGGSDTPPLGDYRHAATRKNNPPAKIAAEGTVPAIPRAQYAYNAHLPPVLRFQGGSGILPESHGLEGHATILPDDMPQLVAEAGHRPLTPTEQKLLAEALRRYEPWLEWTGKREKKWFEVDPVALHIHERISAQAILKVAARQDVQRDLFADPQQEYHEAVQFYRHDVDWANRLILGDSLHVMSSLARREDLAGKVQMIYLDPPYGIKFASNFQPEVGRRDVKDKEQDLTREPEMVKAYRDTWHLGIHSYLSYLRDRLIVARELLADTGSIFVQISDENLRLVNDALAEVFGPENQLSVIAFRVKSPLGVQYLGRSTDFLIWFARDRAKMRYRQLYARKSPEEQGEFSTFELPNGERRNAQQLDGLPTSELRALTAQNLASSGYTPSCTFDFVCEGKLYVPPRGRSWKTNPAGMPRLLGAGRLIPLETSLRFAYYFDDFPVREIANLWTDTFAVQDKEYVVQTSADVIARCMLMTTDPGDLVLDPTCGGGTTAYVAEQWGRRWITIDTSRVAIAIARQRLVTAKFDMHKLRTLAAEDTTRNPAGTWLRERDDRASEARTFDCKRVPHVGPRSIAQNVALDPIFAKHEPLLDAALAACNAALAKVTPEIRARLSAKLVRKEREEGKRAVTDADRRRWELPPGNREEARRDDEAVRRRGQESRWVVDLSYAAWYHWEVPFDTDPDWPSELRGAVTAYRKAWRAKMDEVNACIAASAVQEELVDQPEIVRGITRVSGPFTVEAVQPPEVNLGDNLDAYTGGADDAPADGGLFDGEPAPLPEGFEPRTLRMVEPRPEMDARNLSAYLDQMFRYLRADGVRFLNNKQARWSRFEPLFESGRAELFHAEGRWVADHARGSDQSRDRQGAEPPDDAPGSNQTDDGPNNVAVIFGPQYGPVTAKVVEEAIRAANRKGYEHLLIAGFSFDGAATGVLSEADEDGGVFHGRGGHRLHVHFAHVRPDINPGMNGLLKESPQAGAGQLFSVFGLPRISVRTVTGHDSQGSKRDEYVVEMEGVDIYNPVDNSIASTGAEKVAAWFLDGDFDGRTFCVTQAFFPDRSAWDKLARALNGKDGPIDAERFEAFSGTTSLPFPAGEHRCVAVKVIDPRGNEVMTVERL